MEKNPEKYISLLIERYTKLAICKGGILDAYHAIKDCYRNKGKLLVAGNGGSAADAQHIAGELMKRFQIPRAIDKEFSDRLDTVDQKRGSILAGSLERPLTAFVLTAHEALSTAYINDVGADGVFAQQLYGYGKKGDVFLGISTSGNAENIIQAAVVAKAMEIKVIALTGWSRGEIENFADISITVPETETYKIQEMHLPIYHCLCMMLEEYFFGGGVDEQN